MTVTATYDGRTAGQLAAAAEAVRGLNHVTRRQGPARSGDEALRWPPQVYDVLGDLELVVQRLPQCLGQLTHTAQRWHEDGVLTVDSGTPAGCPDLLSASAGEHLAAAVAALETARIALEQAHEAPACAGSAETQVDAVG